MVFCDRTCHSSRLFVAGLCYLPDKQCFELATLHTRTAPKVTPCVPACCCCCCACLNSSVLLCAFARALTQHGRPGVAVARTSTLSIKRKNCPCDKKCMRERTRQCDKHARRQANHSASSSLSLPGSMQPIPVGLYDVFALCAELSACTRSMWTGAAARAEVQQPEHLPDAVRAGDSDKPGRYRGIPRLL
jgi:hypothetical protein